MENRFLLIGNKYVFVRHDIHTYSSIKNIPNKNCVFFIGNHNGPLSEIDNQRIRLINDIFNELAKKKHRYIIVLGKSKTTITPNINIPSNVEYLYSPNVDYQHRKIKHHIS